MQFPILPSAPRRRNAEDHRLAKRRRIADFLWCFGFYSRAFESRRWNRAVRRRNRALCRTALESLCDGELSWCTDDGDCDSAAAAECEVLRNPGSCFIACGSSGVRCYVAPSLWSGQAVTTCQRYSGGEPVALVLLDRHPARHRVADRRLSSLSP